MSKFTMHNKIRVIAGTGILSAVAFVLMLLEFATPITPVFLKFDFSDLPAFIASFAYGPIAGVLVELIKNLIHLPFTGTSGVGELANFIVGACMVAPAGLIYHFFRSRKGALLGCLTGSLFSAGVSFIVNTYITYPFYINAFHMSEEGIVDMYAAIFPFIDSLPEALLVVNIPFTLLKGVLCSAITFLVYKKLSPILKGKKRAETKANETPSDANRPAEDKEEKNS